MIKYLCIINIGLIFLLNTQNISADEEYKGNKIQGNIETVIVSATRKETTKNNQPDIFVLSAQTLNNIQSQHIQELLNTVPGINFQRGNGQEYLPSIRSPVFTGAGSCGALLTAEDGIPVRSAGFCNVNELFEAHTEAAQRIEVVRGSGTALYGSNALHGLINVITPDPVDLKPRLSFEVGSDGYTRLKLASAPGQKKQLAALLTLTRDGGFREQSGYDQQKLTLKYARELDRKTISAGVTASNLKQETAGFITGLNAYQNTALTISNPTPEAYRDAQSLRAWFRYEQAVLNNATLIITPYARHTDMQFLQHFLPGDPLEENGQNSFGFQSAYYFPVGSATEMVTGLDAEITHAFLKQSQDQPTQGSAFLMETIPVGKHYDYAVKAITFAAFMYADSQLTALWNLIAGLRYEHVGYEYDNQMLSGRTRDDGSLCGFGGCRYSRPVSGTDNFDNFSTHASLNYQAPQHWSAYLKLSNSFRVPQATELYRLQREQSEADLDSETLRGLELGAQIQVSRLKLDASVYSLKKENHIFRDSDFFNVSNGKTKHQGIEVYSSYQVANSLAVTLNATFAKHTYDFDQELNAVNINGNNIDTAPRHYGSLGFDWAITPALSSQLEFLNMGSYYLDPENLHEYTGHQLLNFRGQWNFKPDWQLSFRLNNLLDERYAERADYTSFTQERYFPGRGRSVFVGLEKNL